MRLEVKKSFLLAEALRPMRDIPFRQEWQESFEQKRGEYGEMEERCLDLHIEDKERLKRYNKAVWEFVPALDLSLCRVWPEMGQRSWADGLVPDVALKFKEKVSTSDRIWLMGDYTDLFVQLPLIVFKEGSFFNLDDGSHRAVATYLTGKKCLPAYLGVL